MRRWRQIAVWLLCIVVLAVRPAAAVAQSQPTGAGPEIRVGENVLLVPDKQARSITGWLIVLAGCADEDGGQCLGLAHYLEHLLFINRDNDHRSKVAFFPDGSGNGWTSHRATTYFQRFPSQPATNAANVDKLVGYFAGLLTDLKVDSVQAARERNVVMQEYQQNTGRNPFARFGTVLSRALMPDEPLGQRVIGSPQTIAAFTVEAAQAFHARWYARNNAIIVLHGPFNASDIAPTIERHLALLPIKPIPARVWQEARRYEPGRQLLRRTERDARQSGVQLDRVVTFDEAALETGDNDAALDVVRAFLFSRLPGSPHDRLVEQDEVVTDARLSIARVRQGTLRIAFSGTPARGVAPEQVLETARRYIAELARRGLTQQMVDRLKMRIANERALLAEQPALYAQALAGWLAAHHSYADWIQRDSRRHAVTHARVNRMLDHIGLDVDVREVAGIMLPGAPATAGSVADHRDGETPRTPASSPAEAAPQ